MLSIQEPAGDGADIGVVRILFNVLADADNYNAQSLNAREIALRLNPSRYRSTLFFERSPDPRLMRPGIRLVQLPARGKTGKILREMLRAYDFIAYLDVSPASYIYLHLPRWLRRSAQAVLSIEGSRGNLDGVSATVRRYADFVVRHADVRIALTEFLAAELDSLCGLRPDYIIPVGVDTRLFVPPPARNHEPLTVLFVGHLVERKGPHLVVEAARRYTRTRFRLIGHARDEFGRKLKMQTGKDVPSNVSIEDPVPQAQLANIMQECDILMLPSRVEGMPKVTLEAAACGLPCMVFNDYQTPSVVDQVTGFQVATYEEMLSRLSLLIEDAALRQKMGAAAADHARQYSWDQIAARWADVFERLVAQGT